jgi:protein gp37
MAANSKIEWTEATWNPIAGCSIVSPGCHHCYAMRTAARLEAMGQAKYAGTTKKVDGKTLWTGRINLDEPTLSLPLLTKKPTVWFVNSMSDLFHHDVPHHFISRVFGVMASCPQHTFQVLTKRAERMRWYVQAVYESPKDHDWWPSSMWHTRSIEPLANVWLGASTEDQPRFDERINWLLQTPAAVRFISAEPLLGPIDAELYLGLADTVTATPWLDWVIAGGESGHGARPMHPDWARRLRDECVAASVPFFFKQWGEWADFDHAYDVCADRRYKAGSMQQVFVAGKAMNRVGKIAAGRLLDGREWNEMPSQLAEAH